MLILAPSSLGLLFFQHGPDGAGELADQNRLHHQSSDAFFLDAALIDHLAVTGAENDGYFRI